LAIEEIKNYIKDKVEEKVQEVLRRANLVKKREISQAEKKLDMWIKEQTKAFLREKISLIAQYKARTYREISLEETKLKERLWVDFFTALKERIRLLRSNRQKYSSLLLRMIKSAYPYCSCGTSLLVHPEDVSLVRDLVKMHCNDLDISVRPDDSVCMGVVVVDKDEKSKINYDMLTILDAEAQRIKTYFFSKLMKRY